jgi:hypothetical protein
MNNPKRVEDPPYANETVYTGASGFAVRTYVFRGNNYTMFYEPASDRGWVNDLVIMIWGYKIPQQFITFLVNQPGARSQSHAERVEDKLKQ